MTHRINSVEKDFDSTKAIPFRSHSTIARLFARIFFCFSIFFLVRLLRRSVCMPSVHDIFRHYPSVEIRVSVDSHASRSFSLSLGTKTQTRSFVRTRRVLFCSNFVARTVFCLCVFFSSLRQKHIHTHTQNKLSYLTNKKKIA